MIPSLQIHIYFWLNLLTGHQNRQSSNSGSGPKWFPGNLVWVPGFKFPGY